MNNQQTATPYALVTCGLVGILLVGAVAVGSMFLFMGRATPSSGPTPSPPIERGYALVPGTLEELPTGHWRATIRVELSPTWSLEAFEIDGEEARYGPQKLPATLTSSLPALPTAASFDLTFEFPPSPAESANPEQPTRLRFELDSRARHGMFGLGGTNSSRTCLFNVLSGRLVERVP